MSLTLLMEELGGDARDETLVLMGLRSRRALACACTSLRGMLTEHFHLPVLVVCNSDATWDNAMFVASLVPAVVTTLRVQGEAYLPEMRLAHYQTLPRLKIGAMGVAAALFFGAALAKCDCMLRLSDGVTVRDLKGLRERPLGASALPATVQAADLTALLSVLCLNRRIDFKTCLDEWMCGT